PEDDRHLLQRPAEKGPRGGGADPQPLRRQPAARRPGQVAGSRAARADPEQPDRRGRRGLQGRGPRHPAARGERGEGRRRHLRPRPGTGVGLPPRPARPARPGGRGHRRGTDDGARHRRGAERVSTATAPAERGTSSPGSRSLAERLRGRNNEGVLALTILVLVLVMSLVNSDFFTVSTLFSILRNSLVEMVFALGVLIVIISGGIDVSFPVIGIFAGYTAIALARNGNFDPGVIGALLIAIVVGSLLGLVNGGLVARFRLPTLIVTLGTQGIFRGVLLAYVGSKYIAELPQSLGALSTADLITHQNGSTTSRLHVFIIPVVLLCLAVHWLLQRTMFGRGVSALGGDSESARRAGFPVVRLQV